jgi:YebC/PmpR family DNA-binding regulatory protein
MGAQWKHAGRVENSNKKGQIIGKLVKEIIVSAKTGDPNPEHNHRLRAAIEAAKKNSVPRDTIERAIKKGSGQLDGEAQFETVTYEGFAPHHVPLVVECLTDNKNRTAADVRVLFRKGQLGSIGSVAWMFDRVGVVEASLGANTQDLETVAIEAGAQSVEALESSELAPGHVGGRFFCDATDLGNVSKELVSRGWNITLCEMSYQAKTPVSLDEAKKTEVVQFLTDIDDHDDVHRVYTAL